MIKKTPAGRGDFSLEQATGIGPAYLPWQGNVLPLNYACMALSSLHIISRISVCFK